MSSVPGFSRDLAILRVEEILETNVDGLDRRFLENRLITEEFTEEDHTRLIDLYEEHIGYGYA